MTAGHGHVFRRPDGSKAGCGGPGVCAVCDVDLARFAETRDAAPIAGRFRAELEAELQECFDRARAAT